MTSLFARTRAFLLAAALSMVVAGLFVVPRFFQHVFVPCRGTLQPVPHAELHDASIGLLEATDSGSTELQVRIDEVEVKERGKRSGKSYEHARVVWARADAPCTCGDLPIAALPGERREASALEIKRQVATGLFVVVDRWEAQRAVFRKVDDRGHRFQPRNIVDPHNLSFAVFLLALGGLVFGAVQALRARPYATSIHTWLPGTQRYDGLVEGENGAAIGRIDAAARVPIGWVLVDPAALEGRDVYREMPILGRNNVAAGSHERWVHGTLRRLRDARALAVVATATTVLALVARLLA